MRDSDLFAFALGCAIACQVSHTSADTAQCDRVPWAVTQVFDAEQARLRRGMGGECIGEVRDMTGDAMLFAGEKTNDQAARVALFRHDSGHYLRFTTWKSVRPYRSEDPLVLELENGDTVKLRPTCEIPNRKLISGYYHVQAEQLATLSEQGIVEVKFFARLDPGNRATRKYHSSKRFAKDLAKDHPNVVRLGEADFYYRIRIGKGQAAERGLTNLAHCMLASDVPVSAQ